MPSNYWNWRKIENIEYWKSPAKEVYAYLYLWSKKPNNKSLLDLGAGIGRHSLLFAKHGFDVTALDSSLSGIEDISNDLKKSNIKVNVIQSDMRAIPFSDNRFDFLIAYNSVYHSDDTGIRAVIKEIHRVLKPYGEAFITLLSKEDESFLDNIENLVSENTLLKKEQDDSVLPHFFVDKDMIPKLFDDFKINSIYQSKEFHGDKSFTHFNVHLIKKEW